MGASIGYEGEPTRKVTYECQCVWEGRAEPACTECKGSSSVSFDVSGLHVCYSTMGEIFKTLDITGHDVVCGSIDAAYFKGKLLFARDIHEVPYYTTLLDMADAAVKAGKLLSWG